MTAEWDFFELLAKSLTAKLWSEETGVRWRSVVRKTTPTALIEAPLQKLVCCSGGL